MEIRELSALIRESGVIGAGGAGFPTYAKFDERAKTILLNCAECEPLLKLHRQLLRDHTEEILWAFNEIGTVLGSEQIIVGVKKAYKETVAALNAVKDKFPKVSIALLKEIYPAGDEVVLIYNATGKVVRPGGLPIEQGVAVFNVETVYNVYRALKEHKPVTEKLVTVVGEVERPVTVQVPLGITLDETVALAGNITVKDYTYVVGGPMMGRLGNGSEVVTKTTNGIIVLPSDHYLIKRFKKNPKIEMFRAAASCCTCRMCTELCPRHQLGHPIEPHRFMQAATCKNIQDTNAFLNTFFCSSCGLCENFSCPQGLSPRSLIAEYKAGLRKAGVRPPKVEASPVDRDRDLKQAPVPRVAARLKLLEYEKDAPMQEVGTAFKKVKINCNTHIGAPAVPSVKTGDNVVKGQVVAAGADGLSVSYHSSIDGIVTEIGANYIVIQAVK